MTINIPDELAERLKGQPAEIAELIQRGLAQPLSSETALAEEVIKFLGQGPGAEEIIAFHPSAESVERAAELIERNSNGSLRSGAS